MPTQVMVIPISEKHHDYAEKVHKMLEAAGVRVETDYRAEKMGYKIREAQLKKIPYMLVVGDKEAEENTVAVRARKEEKGGTKPLTEFIEQICKEIESKER